MDRKSSTGVSADWFPWLKVLSVEVGILLLLLFRIRGLGKRQWGQWIVYFFLAGNIFEAVFRDVVAGSLANYLNAIAGVLLVLTLEEVRSIHIDAKKRYHDLAWGKMTLAWILGYTLWNWTFIYLNFGPASALPHVAVLGAALVVAFVCTERWLQARIFTLGTYFVIFHTFPHLNPGGVVVDVQAPFDIYVALLSVATMAVYAVAFYRRQSSSPEKIPRLHHNK